MGEQDAAPEGTSQRSGGTRSPITKSSGSTPAERYLEALCERNFLSLWSYPRPFRNQGGNKELCDLLVVMGDDVIVFSDKHCVLKPKSTLEVDWATILSLRASILAQLIFSPVTSIPSSAAFLKWS